MRDKIQFRSDILQKVHAFFSKRAVLEVDTALISEYGVTDVAIASVPCADGAYLITSPEYAMKMLLCRGSGDIYQLGHVFRNEESGRRHKREFTLLEWYRVGWNHQQLMQEVADLVQTLWPKSQKWAVRQSPYAELFQRFLSLDIRGISDEELRLFTIARIPEAGGWTLERDGYLDLLFTHFIEMHLGQECLEFVVDYPPSQAALAKIMTRIDEQGRKHDVAARFELYAQGMELCNGFWELTDAMQQRQRFEQDNAQRKKLGLPLMPLDEPFLQTLAMGMPESAGVALGLDRLLMLIKQVDTIEAVVLT